MKLPAATPRKQGNAHCRSAVGGNAGGNDDRERRADRKRHAHRFRHVEHGEHLIENRHDDGAAAHAEEAGENAGHHARHHEGGREP